MADRAPPSTNCPLSSQQYCPLRKLESLEKAARDEARVGTAEAERHSRMIVEMATRMRDDGVFCAGGDCPHAHAGGDR